jgi:hypothetical protein
MVPNPNFFFVVAAEGGATVAVTGVGLSEAPGEDVTVSVVAGAGGSSDER